MESEIFKFICANQGAVDTDVLVYNLDFVNVSQTLSNRQRFVHSCMKGQPRVVARTGLTLCRRKDCQGTCGSLHLCKNFLFSGSCNYTRSRRTCIFSHDLNSDLNQVLLQENELETLSRAELCTLLLQNDNTLLPPICFDYNNGLGEFGRCQEGNACKRMHICEGFLKGDCSCFRSHDFNDPQPLKCLKDKGVPEDLYRSLKVIYTNKVALRRNDRSNHGNRGRRQARCSTTGAAAAANYSDAGGDSGSNSQPMQVDRGRGRGGHRGNRGKRGNRGDRGNQRKLAPDQRAISSSDILADIRSFNLYTVDGRDEGSVKLSSSTSDLSAAANDTDASSEDGQSRNRKSASAGGRGGNRGKKYSSTNDSAVGDKGASGSNDQDRRQWQRPVRDKTEICMYFIKGHCKHEEKCFKAHDKMPYRWEVKEGDQWKALPNNEAVEKDYCDPKNSYSSSSPPVYFDTMSRATSLVRRLSTTNSLVEPTFIHTTEWLWYWEDELGIWNLYASAGAGRRSADIDSAYLEQKYLDNHRDVVEFTAGSQSYTLSFQDMIQTNKQYGTKRLVKRRPKFVSATDVQEKRVRRPLVPTLAPIPDHWDKTQIPATGFKRIYLPPTSDEFKEIEALFLKTMIDFDVVKIERIQNKSLWEIFQWQKNQMKINNNGRVVTEKKLFHGTNSKNVDPICLTNFDWRICGTHGTAFGKGSYFARDSKYSHSYTDDSDVKSMFVSRVLVGDFTKGSPEYCRAPSKDGGDVNFFHSCVDNVQNPSIFVVFDKPQIYPEYLLQYKNVSFYGGASVAARPAPKPSVPVPQPRIVPTKPSMYSYQASAPSSQPSASASVASSYQPRASASVTSSYQPRAGASSASSYNSVAYSYPSGTSSYRSSTTSSTMSNNPFTFDTWSSPSTDYRAPSRSSPSPPPTAKPKKPSDSCVIA